MLFIFMSLAPKTESDSDSIHFLNELINRDHWGYWEKSGQGMNGQNAFYRWIVSLHSKIASEYEKL